MESIVLNNVNNHNLSTYFIFINKVNGVYLNEIIVKHCLILVTNCITFKTNKNNKYVKLN